MSLEKKYHMKPKESAGIRQDLNLFFFIVQYYRPCREIKEDKMAIDAQYGPAITFEMTDLIIQRHITIIWFYPP